MLTTGMLEWLKIEVETCIKNIIRIIIVTLIVHYVPRVVVVPVTYVNRYNYMESYNFQIELCIGYEAEICIHRISLISF